MKVDLIIPFYGKVQLLQRCLEGLLVKQTKINYSICLVDDCSPNPEVEPLLSCLPSTCSISVIRMKTRKGFIAAVNYAWSKCNGDFAVIINSDTIPNADLIANLISVLDRNPGIAAVSPASDNPKDLFQYRKGSMTSFFKVSDNLQYSFTAYLTAMCLAIRRSAITEEWLFDSLYAPGYFEDLDLSCRLRRSGWSLAILESDRIHHQGAATFGSEPLLNNIIKNNYEKFSKRWSYLPEHSQLDFLLCH